MYVPLLIRICSFAVIVNRVGQNLWTDFFLTKPDLGETTEDEEAIDLIQTTTSTAMHEFRTRHDSVVCNKGPLQISLQVISFSWIPFGV